MQPAHKSLCIICEQSKSGCAFFPLFFSPLSGPVKSLKITSPDTLDTSHRFIVLCWSVFLVRELRPAFLVETSPTCVCLCVSYVCFFAPAEHSSCASCVSTEGPRPAHPSLQTSTRPGRTTAQDHVESHGERS